MFNSMMLCEFFRTVNGSITRTLYNRFYIATFECFHFDSITFRFQIFNSTVLSCYSYCFRILALSIDLDILWVMSILCISCSFNWSFYVETLLLRNYRITIMTFVEILVIGFMTRCDIGQKGLIFPATVLCFVVLN